MKVKKFLLTDNADNNYSDLIIFEEKVELDDIRAAVDNVKKAFPTSYTRDDVLKAFDELGNYELIDLFNIFKIEY